MMLDIIFLILLALAIYNGIKNGAVVTIFSFFALFIGLIAAFKLSNLVAIWLGELWKSGKNFLPHLAFILVFVLTIIIVKLVAKFLKSVLSAMLLGWIDKLIGIAINLFCYTLVYGIFLFYGSTFKLIPKNLSSTSKTYPYLEQFGKGVVTGLSYLFSWLKDILN